MPDAQVDMLNSDQVRDLEEQIQSATLTPGEAREYFDAPALAIGFLHGGKGIATTSQIEQLAHKNRTAVKGLNPWEDGRIDFFPEESRTEKLKLPEPKPCEFCGRPREYLAILNHTKHLYEWEVEKWSQIPKHCDCEEARAKREAEEAERQRQEEEERRQREEDERKRRIQTQLARSGMKSRFLTRTFANFQTNTQRRTQAARTAREYADNFTAHRENGDGLYIEGTYGTGKTHLAAAISIQLMEQGYSVIFGTADDLLREIKATFDDNGGEQKVLERFKHCDLLVRVPVRGYTSGSFTRGAINTLLARGEEATREKMDSLLLLKSQVGPLPAGGTAMHLRDIDHLKAPLLQMCFYCIFQLRRCMVVTNSYLHFTSSCLSECALSFSAFVA